MINEQTGLVYDCDPNSLVPCQYPTGEAALELYGMDGGEGEKWLCVLWMGLFLVGFVAVAAAAMAHVNLAAQDKEEEPDFEPADREEAAATDTARLKRAASNASRLGSPVHAAPSKQLFGRPSSSAGAGAGNGTAAGSAGDVAMHVPLATHALPPNPAQESSALIRAGSGNGSVDGGVGAAGVAAPHADREHAHAAGGYISWSGLKYTVEVGGAEKERTLLHEVFGFAKPGMMVALMGASGAGQSTPAAPPRCGPRRSRPTGCAFAANRCTRASLHRQAHDNCGLDACLRACARLSAVRVSLQAKRRSSTCSLVSSVRRPARNVTTFLRRQHCCENNLCISQA